MSNAETKIKRKDPKSMSIEELEEYISRNRNRFKPDNETKSLNSSFQSQRNMNYSFNEPNQGKFNNKFQSGDEQAKTYGLNYSYLNGIKPATNNTTSSLANKIQDIRAKSKDNSPRNKSFNFNNVNNPFIQQETKSSSVNNYITSLQEKIKQLQYENEDLKKNFVQVSELLEKERGNFQQFENDQREFKEEWAHYENENKDLINENEQLKLQLSLQNENIVLLEKEKERHLDQNANEKEILENKISSLIKQDEDNRNRIHSLGEENCLLNEKLLQIEKNLKHLHEENSNFKRENREILKELTDTREFKLKFEKERDEYIQVCSHIYLNVEY